jgi:MFS family permease
VGGNAKEAEAGWVQGLLLASGNCLLVLGVSAILPIIPAMLHAFRGQPGIAMMVRFSVVTPMFATALTGPAAGAIGDKIGRRRLFNLSILLYAIFGILPFWLTDIRIIVLTRVLLGITASGMITSVVGLTGDYFAGSARQRWLAVQGAAGAIAVVVSSAASGAIGELSWRLPFLMMSAGIPLFILLLAFPGPPPTLAVGDAEEILTQEPAPMRLAPLVAIFAIAATASFVLWPPTYAFGILLEEKGIGSVMLTGLTTSVLAIGAVVGAGGVALLKNVSLMAKQAVAFLIAAAGTTAIWGSAHLPVLMLGAFAVGVAQGLILPTLSDWLLGVTPLRLRGRVVGLYQSVFFLSQFASPLLAQALASTLGSTTQSMSYYAAGCILPAVVIGMSLVGQSGAVSRRMR